MTFYYPGIEAHDSADRSVLGTKPVVRPEALIKVDRIAHLVFEVEDLGPQEAFMQDFGLRTVEKSDTHLFMAGSGVDPFIYCAQKGKVSRYVGAAYVANSASDLEVLARTVEGASAVEDFEGPGGGSRVILTDPFGFKVYVMHGQKEKPVDEFEREKPLPVNTPFNKQRVNRGQRPEFRPTNVFKLGHIVLRGQDFQSAAHWYMRTLGVIPSDVNCDHDGNPRMMFGRLDRGDQPADHHTVAIAGGAPESVFVHAAFETLDIDEIGQGQQYLASKGWDHNWGIGRHILGSQLFDYWFDPHGFEFEHYADGDVYTADHPTGYGFTDRSGIWMWGPDLPMTANKLSPEERETKRGGIDPRSGKPRPWM
ncbi:MAG: VOC family protein [Hyphomonas sp.]|nr:VOC family protein [Hyphomonas sp.]